MLGQTIVRGTRLPAGTTQIERTVRLPAVQRTTDTVVALTCPAGFVAQNVVPSSGGGPAIRGARLEDPARLGRARRVDVRMFWTRSPRRYTATVQIGLVCSRRR
ncbi:MAG TPA: hypothetical protein VNA28_00720 [Solirubrobacteraceae bacterium]|nr:hypothetical protein [Solirubrobacteraceae bacterium]